MKYGRISKDPDDGRMTGLLSGRALALPRTFILRRAQFDRLAAEIRIFPLLDGRIEGDHVDVDDLALAGRGLRLVVVSSVTLSARSGLP